MVCVIISQTEFKHLELVSISEISVQFFEFPILCLCIIIKSKHEFHEFHELALISLCNNFTNKFKHLELVSISEISVQFFEFPVLCLDIIIKSKHEFHELALIGLCNNFTNKF